MLTTMPKGDWNDPFSAFLGVIAIVAICGLFGWGWYYALKSKEARQATAQLALGTLIKSGVATVLVLVVIGLAKACH